MALLVLANPGITADDLILVQGFRKRYDELYFDVVGPHFTLVFPVEGGVEDELTGEIEARCSELSAISFSAQSAVVHKDELSDCWYCFLLPGQGCAQILKMHSDLHSGILFGYKRVSLRICPILP